MGKGIKIYFALAAVVALGAAQAGCGKKGPPVAPRPRTASAEIGRLAHYDYKARSQMFSNLPFARD